MQAIILAAGMGKRLGALTRNNTKCNAVRLLTTAHSVPFDGKATLFVAERTGKGTRGV